MKPCFTAFVLAFLVSGCTVNPSECDPLNRDASIVAKANCNYSGAYQTRVSGLENVLLDEQKMNVLFRDVYAAVEKEKAEISRELKSKRTDYSALNHSLNALLAELKLKAKGNQKIEAEIDALKKELETVNNSNDPVVMKKQVELDQLKTRVKELEDGLGLK